MFDENSFDFKLSQASQIPGVYYQSEVLLASATMKKGESQGLPVPLHCTWYNVRPTEIKGKDEFILIENLTSSAYQPNVDDIGSKICVHAIPASDIEEY